MTTTNDPALYRKLSEPHESVAEFNDGLRLFYAELRELRAKYRLRDVLVVISGCAYTASGEEGEFITHSHNGDPRRTEAMAAYALGCARLENTETIARILRGQNSGQNSGRAQGDKP